MAEAELITLLTQQGLPTAILCALGLGIWRAGSGLAAWLAPRVDLLVQAGAGLAREVQAHTAQLEHLRQASDGAEARHAVLVRLAEDSRAAAEAAAKAAESAAAVSREVLAIVKGEQ